MISSSGRPIPFSAGANTSSSMDLRSTEKRGKQRVNARPSHTC